MLLVVIYVLVMHALTVAGILTANITLYCYKYYVVVLCYVWMYMCFYKDENYTNYNWLTASHTTFILHNILLTLFVPTDRPRTILIVNAPEKKSWLCVCERGLELCGLDKLKASWKQYVFLRRSDS